MLHELKLQLISLAWCRSLQEHQRPTRVNHCLTNWLWFKQSCLTQLLCENCWKVRRSTCAYLHPCLCLLHVHYEWYDQVKNKHLDNAEWNQKLDLRRVSCKTVLFDRVRWSVLSPRKLQCRLRIAYCSEHSRQSTSHSDNLYIWFALLALCACFVPQTSQSRDVV